MEQFKCVNRVWVSGKAGALEQVLRVCCWITLILNLIMFMMEGLEGVSVPILIFSIIVLLFSGVSPKDAGVYKETLCVLNFSDRLLIWKYPEFEGKHLKYTICSENVIDVAVSSELQSIRLACIPVIDRIDKRGKHSVTDCQKDKKQCVLIIYNENIQYLCSLIDKYLHVNINVID